MHNVELEPTASYFNTKHKTARTLISKKKQNNMDNNRIHMMKNITSSWFHYIDKTDEATNSYA